jgi:hypothetical protein
MTPETKRFGRIELEFDKTCDDVVSASGDSGRVARKAAAAMTRNAKIQKLNEPSLRELLSQNVLEVLVADAREHLTSVIEKLREKSPEKYVEAAVRAMAAAEPKKEGGWEAAQSMQDIGRKLLQSVGTPDHAITDQAIEDAVAANDEFIAKLQLIRDAQGPMQ